MSQVVIRNLSKSFGELTILDQIELTIEQGEKVAVIGPSGLGKTTLLNAIGLLDLPDSMDLQIAGQTIDLANEAQCDWFHSHLIGFGFQQSFLLKHLSLFENLSIPLETRGESTAFINEKVTQLLTSVGLGERVHHYPFQLSAGQRQRGALCRAFITDPKLLLLDEPTGNLDQASSHQLMQLVVDLTKNSSVLLSTHDASLLAYMDRVLTIKQGKLVEVTA